MVTPWLFIIIMVFFFYTLARYVFDLAFDGKIKAAVVSHPSLLKPPQDFEVIFSIFFSSLPS